MDTQNKTQREIKFRYLFEDTWGKKHILTETIEELEYNKDIRQNIERGWVLIARVQYTGLQDKNGKEIYEGDLIKDSDSEFIGEVIWDSDTLCFTTKFQSNELWGFVPRHGKDNHCEVIGNVMENPELLSR